MQDLPNEGPRNPAKLDVADRAAHGAVGVNIA